LNDPSSQAQQSQVVSAASALAQGINALSDAYTSQRQTAQDSIVAGVATLNATLGTIGGLSDKIVALKAGGRAPPTWRTSATRRWRHCRNCST
jgi:flagellar hook-associated protein 1 FlgK